MWRTDGYACIIACLIAMTIWVNPFKENTSLGLAMAFPVPTTTENEQKCYRSC